MTNAYPWLDHLQTGPAGASALTGKYDPPREWGNDIAMPEDTPITSPVAGPVVGQGKFAGGGVITIRAIVEGVLTDVYFQHLDCMYVKYGDEVKEGQIIGTSGGGLRGQVTAQCNTYSDSLHSTGPHVEIGFNYGKTGNKGGVGGIWGKLPHPSDSRDSIAWLTKVASGHYEEAGQFTGQSLGSAFTAGITAAQQGTGSTATLQGWLQAAKLTPSSDITALLVVMDQIMEVQNPIVQAIIDTANDRPTGVISETVDFFKFLAIDSLISFYAFIFRAIFMVIGVILAFKVISSFIDFEQVQAAGFQAARVGVMLGG